MLNMYNILHALLKGVEQSQTPKTKAGKAPAYQIKIRVNLRPPDRKDAVHGT